MYDAPSSPPDRRTVILDAAERCFVRQGFHHATMQEIATEAGMSAGNLYRYFPSKDSIVEGLCERDRSEVARDFEAFDRADDFMAVFRDLGAKHFHGTSRDKSIMCLQIWAEATRNAAVSGLVSALNTDIVETLTAIVEQGRRAGSIAPTAPSRTVATIVATLADGLFVRRAVVPGFDPDAEIPPILDLIGRLLSAQDTACPAPPPSETTP
jgi:TetR/AcrR family transcriptional repressor of uid operon